MSSSVQISGEIYGGLLLSFLEGEFDYRFRMTPVDAVRHENVGSGRGAVQYLLLFEFRMMIRDPLSDLREEAFSFAQQLLRLSVSDLTASVVRADIALGPAQL